MVEVEDKMNVEMYRFPVLSDGYYAVEKQFLEFNSQYRNGEKLDIEQLDWMDWANTILLTTS